VSRPLSHRLPLAEFTELSQGQGGSSAVEILTQAWISRRKLLILAVDQELGAHKSQCGAADVLTESIDVLDRVERRSPDLMSGRGGLFRHPYLAVWAKRLITGLIPANDDAALGSAVSYLAAGALAAAARAELDVSVSLPAGSGAASVAVPGVGVLDDLVPGAPLNSGQLADHIDRRRRERSVGHGSWRVWLDDTDPYRAVFGHPVQDRLTRSSAGAWRAKVNDALTLIDDDFAEYAPGIRAGLETLTPLCTPEAGGDVSATAREAHGAIGCAPTEHPATLALLVLHEFQHAKLYAVNDLEPLYIEDEVSYYVPWREDRRPFGAALQGAYAHLAVTEFWRRTRWRAGAAHMAHQRFAHWRAATTTLIHELLLAENLTDCGRVFVEGMASAAHEWDGDRVPPGDQRAALSRLRDHRQRCGAP
jgi:uncharacterized protein